MQMLSASEQRLKELWQKAFATDPSEREPILFQFRDALHEDLEQIRAEMLPKGMRLVSNNSK
jgi:hypothetical protein